MKKAMPRLLVVFAVTLLAVYAQTTPQALPGAAKDIAIGANNTVWIVGTDNSAYKWDGKAWQKRGQGVVKRIAVDPQGNPWAIAGNSSVVQLKNNAWVGAVGKAQDLAIGANGKMFSVDLAGNVLPWTGSNWGQSMATGAVQIAVDPKGNPWYVAKDDSIFAYTGKIFQQVAGQAKDLGIGKNGAVLHVGADFNRIWRLQGNDWLQDSSVEGATRLAVDANGNPWVVSRTGAITRGIPQIAPPPAPPPDTASALRPNGIGRRRCRWPRAAASA